MNIMLRVGSFNNNAKEPCFRSVIVHPCWSLHEIGTAAVPLQRNNLRLLISCDSHFKRNIWTCYDLAASSEKPPPRGGNVS